jgi:phosphotriesterase-related protein
VFVQTMRGPVDVDDLGFTLMHEHVFVQHMERDLNRPEYWENDQVYVDAIAALNKLYEQGIRSVVDLTVKGLGQSIPHLQRVATESRVHIIPATGYYTYDRLPMLFRLGSVHNDKGWEVPFYGPPAEGPDPMVESFARDIEVGIEDTGVRAAILKCATDAYGVTEGVERVLRAVAKTHRRTGVPITTHTHPQSRTGLEQQKIFVEEGVDLSRVIIGHSDDSDDTSYHTELMDQGSYIGMDRFGCPSPIPFERKVDVLAELCKSGYASKIVLSHDSMCHHSNRGKTEGWNWFRMMDDIVPGLEQRGVGRAEIEQMLATNPRDIFSRQGGY